MAPFVRFDRVALKKKKKNQKKKKVTLCPAKTKGQTSIEKKHKVKKVASRVITNGNESTDDVPCLLS